MDDNTNKCPKDCAMCSFRQNMFCAAQFGLSNFETMKGLVERINMIEGKLETLQADALLIDPMAQEREAAQRIDSPEKQR